MNAWRADKSASNEAMLGPYPYTVWNCAPADGNAKKAYGLELGFQMPTSASRRPPGRRLMSARKITAAFQAGFGGKADAGAQNLRPGRENRGTAA